MPAIKTDIHLFSAIFSQPLVLAGLVLLVIAGFYKLLMEPDLLALHGGEPQDLPLQLLGRHGLLLALVLLAGGVTWEILQYQRQQQREATAAALVARLAALPLPPATGYEPREQDRLAHREALRAAAWALLAREKEPDIAAALVKLDQNRLDGAIQILRGLLDASTATDPESQRQTAALAHHLSTLTLLSDPHEALLIQRRAVELAPDDAWGWNQLGFLFYRAGNLTAAVTACEQAQKLAQAGADLRVLAAVRGTLGALYEVRGRLADAESLYRQALDTYQSLGLQAALASQYANLGQLYELRGDLDQAEALYQQALALHEALGNRDGIAEQYGNLGMVYWMRGDLRRAESLWRQSLQLAQAGGTAPVVARAQDLLNQLHIQRPPGL